ncbi:uncharacterized protein LOC134252615 [Saccostrea cucullata]|uniref:uncharacterized protein LOC134252615 n=1 Tax=Saccostrea cuccullata TaxID=36930 RepID=UPI002ED0E1B9
MKNRKRHEKIYNVKDKSNKAACSVGVQCTRRKPHQRSKKIQTKIKQCEKAVQCDFPSYKPKVCIIAVQCIRYLEELTYNFKPRRVISMSTEEQDDLSDPSSEDENEDKNNDTDYFPESAEEFLSSEISSDDESDL